MILARTLRRTFLLEGPFPAACIAFLHTDPQLPAKTERTETIAVEARADGLFAMRSSWGHSLTGSARRLAWSLDEAFYRLAAADEGAALGLNAGVVRLGGARVLLVAEIGVELSDLIVALLVQGAAYEGTGLVFARADGFVAHPAKPHLRVHRLASTGLSNQHVEPPSLRIDRYGPYCTIDPRSIGAAWSVGVGPVPVLLLVEQNEGGRPAIAHLRFEPALSRLMRSVRSARKPDMRDFIRFRALVEQARTFRVAMDSPAATAALIIAQMPLMRIDG